MKCIYSLVTVHHKMHSTDFWTTNINYAGNPPQCFCHPTPKTLNAPISQLIVSNWHVKFCITILSLLFKGAYKEWIFPFSPCKIMQNPVVHLICGPETKESFQCNAVCEWYCWNKTKTSINQDYQYNPVQFILPLRPLMFMRDHSNRILIIKSLQDCCISKGYNKNSYSFYLE